MSSYSIDASGFAGSEERVFVPSSEGELVAILREANASRTAVTISGAGTGLTGGRVAQSGWVVSTERLKRLEVHTGHAVCGAGVLLRELQAAAAGSGQFYAPDPTENWASMGGNIATNASGSRSFRYGDTRRHVRALRVVLADGKVLVLRRGEKPPFELPVLRGPSTTKNTAGYYLRGGMDFLDLFIGSEGTLGVVTEAELDLLPMAKELIAGVVFFESDGAALDAVDRWRSAAGLRMLEYMDGGSLDLLRGSISEIPAAARAAVLIESDSEEWLPDAGLEESWFAAGKRDRERFRVFRHALPEAVNDLVRRRGLTKLGSDFAVPVARNREMLDFYRSASDREFRGQYVIFGHIGDAHLHVNLLPQDETGWQRGRALMIEFARKAVELGGTVSAEHGLGKSKKHLLALQYPGEQIERMKAVKRMLDPHWMLGQGTLF